MSAQLRSEARASGWPDNIVRGMHVTYDKGSFVVRSHPDHKPQVLNLEYGTPDTQPTAAIRRFSNRQHSSEYFLLKRAMQHIGRS